MSLTLRYWLLQIPGVIVLGAVLAFALRHELIEPLTAVIVLVLWLLKDAILYIPWSLALTRSVMPMGREALIGREGLAHGVITAGQGTARIDSEHWQARCTDGAQIAAGRRVRVVGVRGMILYVEEAKESAG